MTTTTEAVPSAVLRGFAARFRRDERRMLPPPDTAAETLLHRLEARVGDLTCPRCQLRDVRAGEAGAGTLVTFACADCGYVQVVDFADDPAELRARVRPRRTVEQVRADAAAFVARWIERDPAVTR